MTFAAVPDFPHTALHVRSNQLHTQQAAVVADLGLLALRNAGVQRVMEAAVEAVARTLGHEMCKVLELLPDRRALLLRAGVGWAEGLVGRGTVSAGLESQAGFTLMAGGPVVVPDLPNEKRFNGPPLLHNHGVTSGLSTPIYTSTGPWGVLGTHTKRPHSYTDEDVDFLVAVANVLGAAIERDRHEQELQATKARLEHLDRLRTQFLQNVSHELRTPLTPLALQLEYLQTRLASPQPDLNAIRKAVETAHRSAQRLQRLVEELVDVTRMQTGRMKMELRPMDLGPLVREVAEGFQGYAANKGLDLAVEASDPLPVEGDASRLAQAVTNLLANALKFTPKGGRVVVTAKPEGDFAAVSVTDTGAGFSPEQRPQLFDPFFQARPAPGPETGLGLGLYIVRGIVEQHGGRVEATSPGPGKGATFSFTVRLTRGHRMTERVPAPRP